MENAEKCVEFLILFQRYSTRRKKKAKRKHLTFFQIWRPVG